jgi:hypothetical protein
MLRGGFCGYMSMMKMAVFENKFTYLHNGMSNETYFCQKLFLVAVQKTFVKKATT